MLVKATGINVNPINVINEPVTTGGKNFLIFAKKPAIKKIKIPAAIIDPYMVPSPKCFPTADNGATYSIAHPSTTGNPIPVKRVRFNCSNVAIPHIKISIETK